MRSTMHHASTEDLKHLFEVLEKVLFGLTNREPPNTRVFQHRSPPGPDMVQLKQLLMTLILLSLVLLVMKRERSGSRGN